MTQTQIDDYFALIEQGVELKSAAAQVGVADPTARRYAKREDLARFTALIAKRLEATAIPAAEQRRLRNLAAEQWLEEHRSLAIQLFAQHGTVLRTYHAMQTQGYPGVYQTIEDWWRLQPERAEMLAWARRKGGEARREHKAKIRPQGQGFIWDKSHLYQEPPMDHPKLRVKRPYQEFSEEEQQAIQQRAVEVLSRHLGRRIPEPMGEVVW